MTYTFGMHSVTFVELPLFTRNVYRYLSEEEYEGVQRHLLSFPDSGSMIRGTGGCRKLRWRVQGRGKSGGVRLIYYWRRNHDEIWMLTIYAKNEEESIPSHFVRRLREEIEND